MSTKLLIAHPGVKLQSNSITDCLISTLDKFGNLPHISSNVKTIYLAGFNDVVLTKLLPQLKQYNIEVYNLNLQSKITDFPKIAPNLVFKQPVLLGDRIEKALSLIQADKVAKVYQRITKRPCNCHKRKEILNNFHKNLIKRQ